MAPILNRPQRLSRDYLSDQQSTWELIKQEHDRAMLVYDIEDVVRFGRFAIEYCLDSIERWHHWVSEDAARYDSRVHDELRSIEQRLIEATVGTVELIKKAESWGYNIAHAKEFGDRVQRLQTATGTSTDSPDMLTISEAERTARNEHAQGRTTEIESWGQ